MNEPMPVLLQAHAKTAAIAFVIVGQVYGKANRRKPATRSYRDEAGQIRTRMQFIKSDEARAYERAALLQIPVACRQRLAGPVRVTIRIFYANARSDLDESLLLDVLQDRWAWVKTPTGKVRELVQAGVYRNDRAVKEKHIFHGIDRANPRAEIIVEPLTVQHDARRGARRSRRMQSEGENHDRHSCTPARIREHRKQPAGHRHAACGEALPQAACGRASCLRQSPMLRGIQ